tara:strand:+ start:361 stop:606 length:246 start_codon:yes stop_codon:yes gene_type:complete
MKLIKSYGHRKGYHENHVAFLIKAKYRRKGGCYLCIFVEATMDKSGIRNIYLREDGTNDTLNVENLEDEEDLYELILNQTL